MSTTGKKKVLVCGGRDYKDLNKAWDVLKEIKPDVIIEGGCRKADIRDYTADYCGWYYAYGHCIPCITHWANWGKHGKAAGPIRNQEMLDMWQPDLVVAFPGGDGTKSMVELARKAGVEVKEIT